jgi:hypothetical protein
VLSSVGAAAAQGVAGKADDVPAAHEDGGPRNFALNRAARLLEQLSAKARGVARQARGTILDNLGCRRAEGRAWRNRQPLGSGRRGYLAAAFLELPVSPDGSIATDPDGSALRAEVTKIDAAERLPCSPHAGQPMGQCEFGVARAGGGYATVAVTRPIGRGISFRIDRPIGADASQADGCREFRLRKESELNLIRVGAERYEIPAAVVLGG